jgi:hypothetical protein
MQDNLGLSTRVLVAGPLELTYLDAAGPRIVGLRYKSSANLLASVPEIAIPTPFGEYRYIGGHRLWYAPEAMPRSYVPDHDGVTVTELPDGILLQSKQEAGTGIQKNIEIHLHSDRPQVTLKHTLVNEGLWDVELAPWTITMFRLGGTAILPFQSETVDMDGLLPDRRIALWPYSKINDPRLRFDDDFIFVSAKPDLPLFKIGVFNPRGWIAYWDQGILFRKTFNVQTDGTHPDHGCNAEIYCDEHFIELESLAPLVKLAAGGSVSHTENWELYDELEQDFLPEEAIRLVG